MILSKTIEAPTAKNRLSSSSSRLLLLSVAALVIAACKSNDNTAPDSHEEMIEEKIAGFPEDKPQPKSQKLITDNNPVEKQFQFEDITTDIQKDLERDEKSRSMYVIMIELQKKLEKLHPGSQVQVDVQLGPLMRVENGISYVTFTITIDKKVHKARLVAKDITLTGKDNETLELDALHFARQISVEMRQVYTTYLQQRVYGVAATLTESDDSDDLIKKLTDMFVEEKEAMAKHGLSIGTNITMRRHTSGELLISIPATDTTINSGDISFILGTGLIVGDPTKK